MENWTQITDEKDLIGKTIIKSFYDLDQTYIVFEGSSFAIIGEEGGTIIILV